MTAITIDIQKKSYRHRAHDEDPDVIRNLHMELRDGEFVCLIGPSGCGKTTLLNIVAGLDDDFQGTVRAVQTAKKPKISYVFQNPRLLPWRTVRENIALAVGSDMDQGLVDHLLDAMGVGQVQQQYPERLSLGMSRRVALVRAFATQPDLLLMDEPFVSLDAPTARRVRQLLVHVWRERPHTVLFVTHDLREAIALADRLIFLSARPMSTAAEIPIDLSSEERRDGACIDKLHRQLLERYPSFRNLL